MPENPDYAREYGPKVRPVPPNAHQAIDDLGRRWHRVLGDNWVMEAGPTFHGESLREVGVAYWLLKDGTQVYDQPVDGPENMANVRDLSMTSTRQLLLELRMRAENWAGQPGSGFLADWVDTAMENLTGSALPLLDGKRELE
jgi:hypothetical protein